jgi:hypothetical protein
VYNQVGCGGVVGGKKGLCSLIKRQYATVKKWR